MARGATAGSRAAPDFPELGIELKTLPVDLQRKPRESTWVCTASLDGSIASRWEESRVYRKLECVLWVPILPMKGQPLAERRGAMPQLWRADVDEAMTLRGDWEELSALIREGRIDRLDARTGEAFHLRPKAAHSRELVPALDQEGNWTETNPRGFYLRRSFTTKLIQRGLGWVSS